MKGKTTRPSAKTEERPEGRKLRKFMVRCERSFAFTMYVQAYSEREAELIAEQYCERQPDEAWNPDMHRSFGHLHFRFESEER